MPQKIEDMKNKPLEEWTPKNRVEMEAYRKRLVELMTFGSVSNIIIVLV